VGHLRDVRRLIVAFSRARLGLYIFGRASVFANCYELQPAFRWRTFLCQHWKTEWHRPPVCEVLPCLGHAA